MKKWFVLLLMAVLALGNCALAQTEETVNEMTFEKFYAEYGLPYDGEWVCFDDAIYFYVPAEFLKEEISDEMRANGILACYSEADEYGNTVQIQITRQTEHSDVEVIAESFRDSFTDIKIIRLNGMDAALGFTIRDDGLCVECCVEAIVANRASYRFEIIATEHEESNDTELILNALGMMCSFAQTPLQIDPARVNAQRDRTQAEPRITFEPMSSVITLQFTFHERAAEDLGQINRILASMDLTDARIEEFDGYLATRQKMEEGVAVETTYRYGFDSCTLVCEKAEFGQTRLYQIATAVFEETEAMDSEKFRTYWRAAYPERKLKTLMELECNEMTAFIVVFFEEKAESMPM